MRLTLHTDYALRLLMMLATEPAEARTIAGVARSYGISRHHLVKVAQTLVHGGFLNAQRGRGGGLALARPAASIGLGEVVRATEESLALVECFDRARNGCLIVGACGLRDPLAEAARAFLATLDRYTLADLVAAPQRTARFRRILSAAG